MSVTIYDIAQRAKLSYATVSMALRDLPSIKEETRERVQNLAKEMGYVPNVTAISLKRKYGNRIALVMAIEQNNFMRHVKHECLQHNWDIQVFDLPFDPGEIKKLFTRISEENYIGIITYLTSYDPVSDILRQMASSRPVVLIGPPADFVPTPGLLPIYVDNIEPVRNCIRCLLDYGHSKIIHTTSLENKGKYVQVNEVIKEMLEADGIKNWDPAFYCVDSHFGAFADEGFKAAEILLRDHPEATAVQCFNDQFAFGLIKGLQQFGIRVPEDISVCGSDNTFIAKYNSTGISSVELCYEKTAGVAIEYICRKLQKPEYDTIPDGVTLHGKFIERESTDVPRSVPLLLNKYLQK